MPESAGRPAGQTPEPQGHYAGVPYDWRKPTAATPGARTAPDLPLGLSKQQGIQRQALAAVSHVIYPPSRPRHMQWQLDLSHRWPLQVRQRARQPTRVLAPARRQAASLHKGRLSQFPRHQAPDTPHTVDSHVAAPMRKQRQCARAPRTQRRVVQPRRIGFVTPQAHGVLPAQPLYLRTHPRPVVPVITTHFVSATSGSVSHLSWTEKVICPGRRRCPPGGA